jgi:hypothetical protein
MSQEFINNRPNTGSLHKTKEKRSPSSPDMFGEMDFDRDYLKSLLEKQDGLVKVKLSAWYKPSAAGNTFLSLSVNTYEANQQAPKPTLKDPWDE